MLFIDQNSHVDKEALRQHVSSQLSEMKDQLEVLLHDERHRAFWDQLHALIITAPKGGVLETMAVAEGQLLNLDSFIKGWMDTAVESPERFEFFIQTKASEIRSGDAPKDYFWALQIRHDQLVALIGVMTKIIGLVATWVKLPPSEVLKAEEFMDLAKNKVEDLVYFEAEAIHYKRDKMVK